MKTNTIDASPAGRQGHSGALAVCVAGALVGFSLAALVALTTWQMRHAGYDGLLVGANVLAFALGVWIPGSLNAYLIECFYRKRLFYGSVAVLVASGLASGLAGTAAEILGLRVVQGGAAAVALLALGTLVNDLSPSTRRTRVDTLLSWFRRIALPCGLSAGAWFPGAVGTSLAFILALVPAACAMLVVAPVHVPFRAPLRRERCSCDRFWLPQAFPLVLNLLPAAAAAGMLFGTVTQPLEYGCLAIGCLLGVWCERVALASADERAQIGSGLLMMAAGTLLYAHGGAAASVVALLLLGAGIGQVMSRFLLYFLKLPGHCQRATAQHTYMLTGETGLALGYAAACGGVPSCWGVLALAGSALALYVWITHPWFVKHRDRDFKFREV